jgi:hypothetical protein
MKKPIQRLIIIAGLVAIVAGILSWYVTNRERQKNWPRTQSVRCVALANLLYKYEQKNGSYPESLRDLVDKGLISSTEYQKLMFQDSPRAKAIEWRYFQPSSLTKFALLSKQPIYPWKGSSGVYIIGKPDGYCESIGESKLSWYMKMIQAEQDAAEQPPPAPTQK